jgi:ribonuclease E
MDDSSSPSADIDASAAPSASPADRASGLPASRAADPTTSDTADVSADAEATEGGASPRPSAKKRRRGSRGGKGRKKPASPQGGDPDDGAPEAGDDDGPDDEAADDRDAAPAELPERIGEGRPSPEAAEQALVRRPQIGDTRPAPPVPPPGGPSGGARPGGQAQPKHGQRQRQAGAKQQRSVEPATPAPSPAGEGGAKKRRRGGKGRSGGEGRRQPSQDTAAVVDADVLERRRGRERNGRPIGRYLMCVQVRPTLTQVAVLEGRNLIEHYVSRPSDDVAQIHGNIYLGRVQNVLPGMEAAFVDIGTPKNAVLYRGDVQYDAEDIVEKASNLRIEQMLRARQMIICQVTKNPIGAKGARLTQEVSLPGRFVVLIPNSKTYGISKRLPEDVRKRLRNILDRVKPAEHGLIVRTAAEHATEHELRADMTRLLDQWNAIEAKAKKATSPTLLYREPELAVRVIREEFNAEYRGVVIDDPRLFDDVKDYVSAFNPELADRIELHDAAADGLPLFERHHVHEQLHKALDRKVWLPSGGSLIIEHTEALTVIDVNTGKNVGTTNLEETVFRNNLEAAEEVAKQLRLRDIGGIVVIDFIDMEIRDNRRKVVEAFRSALARDKTRTQVFEISELGLVEMTRKRIGEGLLVNFADQCPNCIGRGVVIDHDLLT